MPTAVLEEVDLKIRDFMTAKRRLLIDGKWVDAQSGQTFPVYNPASGEVLHQCAAGDKGDIDLAVKAARRAFEEGPWSRLTHGQRGKLIWKLADLVEDHLEEFAQLESLDNGKPLAVARVADVPLAVDLLRYMSGWTTKIEGQTLSTSQLGADYFAYTLREPVGVVGQIIPWNFPLLMAAWKLGPALATGCTVVLKPAEQTPLSALLLGELIDEAGFPPGVVNIVTGYGETAGAALAAEGFNPKSDMGPLVSEEQLNRVLGFLEAGRADGVNTVVGGNRIGDRGYFVEPTILTGARPGMRVVDEEIFGPVVCAIPFDEVEQVATEMNQTVFGLAGAIWTKDVGKAHRLARAMKAGTVWINCYNIFDATLPFGGYKQSGWGREMGKEAIELYTEVKSIVVKV